MSGLFLICSCAKGVPSPPPFHPTHTLGDWPECYLEVRCPRCGKVTIGPVRSFGAASVPVLELASRLRCDRCRVAVAPIYLCASPHRSFLGGGGTGGRGLTGRSS